MKDLDSRLSEYGAQWRAGFTPPEMPETIAADPEAGTPRRWVKPLAVAAAAILIPTIAVVAVNTLGNDDPDQLTAGGGPSVSATSSMTGQPSNVGEPPPTYVHDGKTLDLLGQTPWNSPLIDADDAAKLYVFAGQNSGKVDECTPLTVAFVTEQGPQNVTVTTVEYGIKADPADPVACVKIGYPPFRLTVDLDAPLGDRALTDATGTEQTAFNLADFPTLSYVPDGYTAGEVQPQPQGGGAEQTFTDDADPVSQLIVSFGSRSPIQALPGQQKEVLAQPTIKGAQAEVSQSSGSPGTLTISWQVDAKRTIRIQSVGASKAPLSVDELIQVAEGVTF